jgi:hypothetical protein
MNTQKADIFKNIQVGQVFSDSIQKDGNIFYKKLSGNKAQICKTDGKYGSHLIGNIKYFYSANIIFVTSQHKNHSIESI